MFRSISMGEWALIFRIALFPALILAISGCATAENYRPRIYNPEHLWPSAALPFATSLVDARPREADPPRPKSKPPARSRPTPERHPSISGPGSFLEVDSELLTGLSEAEVTQLLGPPRAKTVSALSNRLDYRLGKCHLRLHLFAELRSGEYRVLYMENLRSGATSSKPIRCRVRLAKVELPERFE